MTHLTPSDDACFPSRPRSPRGRRPPPTPETWAEARSRYLDGWSAREICRRLDICLSSFRARAARGGWRRYDQPSPAWPEDWGGEDEEELPSDAGDLHAHAWRHACRAVVRGERLEARTWLKLSAELEALDRERARQRLEFAGSLSEAVAEAEDRLRDLGGDPDAVEPAWPDDDRYDLIDPSPADLSFMRLAALGGRRIGRIGLIGPGKHPFSRRGEGGARGGAADAGG